VAVSNPGTVPPPQGTALWERFLNFLNRERVKRDERQPRKGLAITISTLVSALLWFTFSMREDYSTLLLLPTEVVNLPEIDALKQLPPPTVRAQIEAPGLALIRLRLNPPVVLLNGERTEIDVEGAVAEALPNVRVASVSPGTFTLQKERRIMRRVPIALQASIETPPTHDLVAPPQLSPDSVRISGAASIVLRIDAWPTVPFQVEDLRDSLITRIDLSDTLGGLVVRDLEAVTLTAIAQRFTEDNREIEVTVTGEPSARSLVTLEPATIRVTYKVLFSQYEEAKQAMDFFATVSYDEIRDDTTGRVRPNVHLPSGIVLRDIELIPSTLRYYQRIE
jgi:hypothetical protein